MPQIIPIKDLKNTSEISDMCHKTEEPIYVTKNGYGDMVIMSMEIYEATMKQIAMYRDIEISEKQIEAGNAIRCRRTNNRTDNRIHARCVTAARKYCDFLCTHCKFLHFLIENCKVKNAIQQFIPFIF